MKSGIKGKVYMTEPMSANTSGQTATDIADEVRRFTTTESVAKRVYPHDKSSGWTVNCYGARTMEITLEAALRYAPNSPSIPSVGQKVYLELYPIGVECAPPMAGWAGVDRVTQVCDEGADGEPVGYVATLTSEGPWTGITSHETDDWGGFENGCGESGSLDSISGLRATLGDDDSESEVAGDIADIRRPAGTRGLRG